MLWMLFESGYPKDSLLFSFADTGNEHLITLRQVAWLSDFSRQHGGPAIETLNPELGFYDLARKKKRFPSTKARFCTEELKLKPAKEFLRKLEEEGHEILLHTGVRGAESPERALLDERGFDSFTGMEVYRPLLKWTIEEVWAIHRKYRVPINPLYLKGASRVGCFPCVMSNKMEMRMIAIKFPEVIERLRKEENSFTSRNNFSGFFRRTTVTENHRTKEITTKDGKVMKVCTIDDVVRWSKTARGGKQYEIIFMETEEQDTTDEDWEATCPSLMGACE